MSKQTEYIVIGIGIVSILFAAWGVVRDGEWIDSLSGILIGVALIGTAIIERRKGNKST